MKSVKISDLKANLAKYLRLVKSGEDVDILDRGVWVARLVGSSAAKKKLDIHPPLKEPALLGKLKPKISEPIDFDVMEILEEERNRR